MTHNDTIPTGRRHFRRRACDINDEGALLPHGLAYVIAVIAASLGFLISAMLAWSSVTGDTIAGCGEGRLFDCQAVLHSKFGKIAGVPVSLPGALTIAAILACLCISHVDRPRWRRAIRTILPMSSVAAAGAAVWFGWVQFWHLKELCPFCLTVHLCSLALAALVLGSSSSLRHRVTPMVAAMCAVAIMATIQWSSTAPLTYRIIEPKTSATSYELLEVDIKPLDIADEAIFVAEHDAESAVALCD